jgi:hypothetical protein
MATTQQIIISSLKADISHARRQIENDCGDRAYWERQIEKAERRISELRGGKPFDLAVYVLDMLTIR